MRSAERFMAVAREYDQQTVLDWGVSKCELLLNVEEVKRQEYLKGGSQNVSVRELQSEVRRPVGVLAPSREVEVEKDTRAEDYFLETLELGESIESALKDFSFRVSFCAEKFAKDWAKSPLKGKIEGLEVFDLVEGRDGE